jgi:hypothetical protein
MLFYIILNSLCVYFLIKIYAFNNKVCLASYVEGYPLDLSILISGGKETKRDSPSNGERRGKSPSLNRVCFGRCEMWGGGGSPGCGMNKIVFRQHVPLGCNTR